MSGTPVFFGTRVPIAILFDYLEDDKLDSFLENYSTVTKNRLKLYWKLNSCQMNKKSHSLSLLVSAVMMLCISGTVSAQNKTIVLVRHAEKSATGSAADIAKGDPDLSTEGRERAERLTKAVKKYKPHEIFVTDYKRTRQTAEPIAKLRGKEIQTYDPAKQAELVEKILASKTDHYLIIGHSNTTPALANLLMKKEVFKQLPDTEYGVFWVIRMKKGVVTKVEIFPY